MSRRRIPKPPPTPPATHAKVDATADLYVNVVNEDVACAVPRDHCNCAVAQAIKRAVGRPDAEAVIYPSIAYVLMPVDPYTARTNRPRVKVEPGDLAWHRFGIPCALSKQILLFDESGETAAGGYRFRAISPSQRLGVRRSGPTKNVGARGAIQTTAPWRRDSYFRLKRAPVSKKRTRKTKAAA